MNISSIKIVPEEMRLLNSLGMIEKFSMKKLEYYKGDSRSLGYASLDYAGISHRLWVDLETNELVEHLIQSDVTESELQAFIEKYKDDYKFTTTYTATSERFEVYITPINRPSWYYTPRELGGLLRGHLLCISHDVSPSRYKPIIKKIVRVLDIETQIFERNHYHDLYNVIEPKKYYPIHRKIALAFLVS